jgi:hypothetical protein
VFYLLSFAGWIVINNFFVLFTTKEVNSSSTTGVHSRKKMYRTTTTVLNSWDLCPTEIYTLLLCRQWNRKGIIGCSSNGYRFLISCTVNKHNSDTSAPQRQFSHFLLIPTRRELLPRFSNTQYLVVNIYFLSHIRELICRLTRFCN